MDEGEQEKSAHYSVDNLNSAWMFSLHMRVRWLHLGPELSEEDMDKSSLHISQFQT